MVQRGGRVKVIRRFGTPLPGLTRKSPKGQDAGAPRGGGGASGGRRPAKKSEYGRRLDEKQKLRFHYGVTETQLRRAFEEARRRPGITGHELLALLERRLDNVVFRLGFSPTMAAARQLVSHGHIRLNGKRVDIASQLVQDGDTVSIAEGARNNPQIAEAISSGPSITVPSYLSKNTDDPFAGRLTGTPSREDVPFLVDDTAIVEFYAR